MRIGEVAALAGVNRETLRYYERRGLLHCPARRASGYRDYSAEAVLVVRFIRRAKSLGFALGDIEILLDLAAGGPEDRDAAQRVAGEMIARVDQKLAGLGATRLALEQRLATCHLPPP